MKKSKLAKREVLKVFAILIIVSQKVKSLAGVLSVVGAFSWDVYSADQ